MPTATKTTSLNNKSMDIKDFVVDNKVDILALTEMWLRSGSESDYVVRDICPNGYSFKHVPRCNGTGGWSWSPIHQHYTISSV